MLTGEGYDDPEPGGSLDIQPYIVVVGSEDTDAVLYAMAPGGMSTVEADGRVGLALALWLGEADDLGWDTSVVRAGLQVAPFIYTSEVTF